MNVSKRNVITISPDSHARTAVKVSGGAGRPTARYFIGLVGIVCRLYKKTRDGLTYDYGVSCRKKR